MTKKVYKQERFSIRIQIENFTKELLPLNDGIRIKVRKF